MKPLAIYLILFIMIVFLSQKSGKVEPHRYENTIVKCPHCHTEFKLKDSEK